MTAKVIFMLTVLIASLVIRIPVFASLLLTAVLFAMVFSGFMPMSVIATGLSSGLGNINLSGVIFFFLAGELMTRSGIARKIVNFLRACIGHLRGGLSHINIIESVIFAGVSGSSMADTAAMHKLLVPEMVKDGYSAAYASAITLASSNIGPVIPPSTGLVLLAIYVGANVKKVLMGGLVPGILMAICMAVWSVYICNKRNYPKGEWKGFGYLFKVLRETFFSLIMPVLVVLCLSFGIGTVDEVGAGMCFYCVIVGVFVYKELSLRDIGECAVEAAKTTGKMLSIQGACGIFNWIVASLGLRTLLRQYMEPLVPYPVVMMLVVLAILLIGGCFMSHMVMLYVVTPILSVLAVAAGDDITAFCVFAMIACSLGMITPPVGQLLYVGAEMADVSIGELIKEVTPFIVTIIVALLLLIFFPQIAYFLPEMLY